MTLNDLAIKHGTDKHSGHHDYCRHYDKHFAHLRDKQIKIYEFGVGGYEFPDRGGGGLRMWDEYFNHPKTKIIGIDIHDKSGLKFDPRRVEILKGSQNDGDFLLRMFGYMGTPDIIIDDASHMNNLTIETFKHCFPWLKSGGIYVIEDIESSWWNEHGFDGDPNVKNWGAQTTINMCRALLDIVNSKHNKVDVVQGMEIESMHFYNNMVVIIKK